MNENQDIIDSLDIIIRDKASKITYHQERMDTLESEVASLSARVDRLRKAGEPIEKATKRGDKTLQP